MGNIWPDDQLLLEDIITSFPENRIIVFPQSIYYDNESVDYEESIRRSKSVFNNSSNVTLFVRDKHAYVAAKSIYSHVKVILAPDIGLYLCGKARIERHACSKPTIGLCLREDREKSADSKQIEKILKYCESKKYKMVNVSTTLKVRIPTFAREKAIYRKLQQFGECTIVITDRLHGMIFSLLSDTPCLVFDNRTGKISALYDSWLNSSDHIVFFKDMDIKELYKIIDDANVVPEKNGIYIDFKNLEDEVKFGKN